MAASFDLGTVLPLVVLVKSFASLTFYTWIKLRRRYWWVATFCNPKLDSALLFVAAFFLFANGDPETGDVLLLGAGFLLYVNFRSQKGLHGTSAKRPF